MTETSDALKFRRAAVIGIGLIGASLAHAMRAGGLAERIAGFDLDADVRARALSLGVVDETAESFAEAVKGADLVILSTPVGAIDSLCAEAHAHAENGALVVDTGSVKGAVAEAARRVRREVLFVPCHPVAGTEQSGPEAGFATLFRQRWCILTPLDRTDEAYRAAVEKAAALWRAVGSHVEVMDAAHHDLALAITSHLPHLIAFTLVGAADDLESVAEAEIVKYSAGGFRDFTRIAASDPIMWRDVFLHNREAVLEVLGRFTEELALLQRAIRWGDGETLKKVFTRGRAIRRAIVAAGQETDAPNFGRDKKDA
ncbi:prephenate/arogenate dehydrogenase family protein [Amphiplicatus metriothermophilus]|uniref:prephenate dehydrogenase n=1 Tax=Amphiplicatus metriothermophilus TaxID=1519374 RepID=A0A239PKS2_9PROT|nr:prephenate/arogenate dehydrogenase family protein [Amphiplicatus metriothermophilus]MBB5517268.1 cyclohexadieny/prephenate dehydrogenase [Amphiplicatus metriothermophilus]SNT68396.1 prephenate dehydrogenase [Amphiplicatus metriothermophilus]